MSLEWDIDSYRSEFENEEHWQLKRNFMLAHKDKFPEDELVCLAQAFVNIEFMGCRYPEQTMIRIAELAKGVVEEFREQRKNTLKRTFVAASDAASAKVKGQPCKGEEPVSNKIKKVEETDVLTNSAENKTEKQSTNTDVSRVSKYGGVKTFNIQHENNDFVYNNDEESIPKSNGPLGDFVLILDSTNENPVNIIQRSSAINKCLVRWDFKESGNSFLCELFLNNHCIASSCGSNMKISKEHTAMVAIAKLRESYYGIRVKSKFFSDTTVTPSQLGSGNDVASSQLGEDNIGRKLMKLMGWQGGGLGSHEQGMENPVTPSMHVRRDGLGLSRNKSSVTEFKKKAREYIKTWVDSDSDQDLVFSTDFSMEERKMMHVIANTFSLRSKSYGKESNRQLVISRKYNPWDIVKELLKIGGNSEKYELLHPTRT